MGVSSPCIDDIIFLLLIADYTLSFISLDASYNIPQKTRTIPPKKHPPPPKAMNPPATCASMTKTRPKTP